MNTPTAPDPARRQVPRADLVRDSLAAGLIFLGMFYAWDYSDSGSDLWYVILPTLLAVGGVGASLLAQRGAFGPSWNMGYNRLLRLGAATPWLLAFLVLLILDVAEGGDTVYRGYLDDASGPTDPGGVGTGALIALAGIVLAVQPRDADRVSDDATREDRVWFTTAQAFGGAAVAALVATTVPQLDTGLAFLTVLLVVVLLLLLVVTGLPVVGMVRRDRGWTNIVIGTMAAMVGTSLLASSGTATFGILQTTDGESVHQGYYCMWLLVVAGAAAAAPGTARLLGPLTDQPTLRSTASRALTLLAVIQSVTAVFLVYAIYVGSQTDVSVGASVYVSLVIVVAVTVACALGAADVLRGPDRHTLAVAAAGAYAAGAIVLTIISAANDSPGSGVSSWLSPVVIAGVVVALVLGPRSALRRVATTVQRFEVVDPDAPAKTPTPAPDPAASRGSASEYRESTIVRSHAVAGTAAPTPPPMPSSPAAHPAAGQDWGDLAPAIPAPAAAPDPALLKAQDPVTTAAELAELTEHFPHVRAAIAAHPNAYPDLLAWLSDQGDPLIDAALRRRTSS